MKARSYLKPRGKGKLLMGREDYGWQLIRQSNVCRFAPLCYSNRRDVDMGLAHKSKPLNPTCYSMGCLSEMVLIVLISRGLESVLGSTIHLAK